MNKNLLELDKLYKDNKFNQVIKKIKLLINSKEIISPYYNLIGLSLSKLGKDEEAEEFFTEGIKRFPNEISLKSNIALVQINLKKIDIAEKNLQDALKINKEDIYTLSAFGNLKRAQLKFDEAIQIFKTVCEKDLKFPKALIQLGQSYLDIAQQTNNDEFYELAKKNFLLSSELDPISTAVDYTLSTIIDYSENDFHQKKMLSKIENLNFNDSQKYFIYFSLGKSFEDQKKYDQSFQFIKLANDLRNKSVDKKIMKNEILKYRNIKNIFDNYQFSISNNENLFQKKIIFVVGMPRSGTTLVHQLLSSAERTYGFGESPILYQFFEKNIFNEKFLSKLLNKKTMNEELVKISNEIGERYNSISNEKVFIDKMPPNFYWIGFIKSLFPNSKVVHIKRNIKDNCLSIYKNMFGAKEMDWSYNETNIIKFVINYKDTMKYWRSKYSNFIYEINYEDLVKNKTEETRKLFNFCDLKWDEKIFDFYKTARTIKTVSINQVKKPIYQSSVNSSLNYANYIDFLQRLDDLKL